MTFVTSCHLFYLMGFLAQPPNPSGHAVHHGHSPTKTLVWAPFPFDIQKKACRALASVEAGHMIQTRKMAAQLAPGEVSAVYQETRIATHAIATMIVIVIGTETETGHHAGIAMTTEGNTWAAVRVNGNMTVANTMIAMTGLTGHARRIGIGTGIVLTATFETGNENMKWTVVNVSGIVPVSGTLSTCMTAVRVTRCGKRKRPRAWIAAGTESHEIGISTEVTEAIGMMTGTVTTGATGAIEIVTEEIVTESVTGTHYGRSLSNGRSVLLIWTVSGKHSLPLCCLI